LARPFAKRGAISDASHEFPRFSPFGTPSAIISVNRRIRLRCSENGEGRTMKMIFAQAIGAALSATGALAIFLGVIDHPQVIFDVAATIPAVSPLA
jgi:hypothetical protein